MLERLRPVSRRYRYKRMTAEQFSAALDELGMSVMQFARLYGSAEGRVRDWLHGDEDIPHTVAVFCIAMTVPKAKELALSYTSTVASDVRSDGDRG